MVSSADILNAKILIVDDQAVNVVLLERMLRSAGYVSTASTTDPRAVCDLHRNNHYDLILLDLQMPGMDGSMVHARRNKGAMAVIYLDLDGFKQINDTLGHGGGDVLLKLVAERLVATVREEDTVARLGGDEFAIVLWHVNGTEDTAAVASKVIATVAPPYVIEGHTAGITASAGVSIFPEHGEDEVSLMKSADIALYAAKHAGKNTFSISRRARS